MGEDKDKIKVEDDDEQGELTTADEPASADDGPGGGSTEGPGK